ncbi:MAG: energy-coupling factor transporter ATPase [Actinomycetota bacterium]|nr:energy-coupling factor transporter ATPase [Actinomycetota bacterium]
MIRITGLSFVYNPGREDEILALNDINLAVKEGEFVVVLGRNGSGKSTLARHFNGLLLPTAGEVSVDGLSTKDPQDLWKIRQLVGMVFQNPDNQIVATVVEEDVAFGPENLGAPPVEIRKRVDEALSAVHMSEYARYEPHLLSGGQKQRVAIAGILAMKSKYLVLDEPTSQLDPRGRREVMETLRNLNVKEGVTVVHITHFVEEAIYAERVIVMDKGRVALDGAPRAALGDVERVKSLGITPPLMTILAHHLTKRGLKVPQDILDVEEMVRALCSLS